MKIVGLFVLMLLAGLMASTSFAWLLSARTAEACGYDPVCWVGKRILGQPGHGSACLSEEQVMQLHHLAHVINGDKSAAGDLKAKLGPADPRGCFPMTAALYASCEALKGGMTGTCTALAPKDGPAKR